MKVGTSLIIALLAVIAFLAELVLYFVFGLGSALSGDKTSLEGWVFFFTLLMTLTAATGILAPVFATFGLIIKKPEAASYLLISSLGAVIVIFFVARFGGCSFQKSSSPQRSMSEAGAAYVSNLDFDSVQVVEGFGLSGILGNIENKGPLTIKEIFISQKYMNVNGDSLGQKSVNILEKGTYDQTILRPRSKARFAIETNDAPEQWDKKPYLSVTYLEFDTSTGLAQ